MKKEQYNKIISIQTQGHGALEWDVITQVGKKLIGKRTGNDAKNRSLLHALKMMFVAGWESVFRGLPSADRRRRRCWWCWWWRRRLQADFRSNISSNSSRGANTSGITEWGPQRGNNILQQDLYPVQNGARC